METDYSVRIIGSLRDEWIVFFGTDIIPINPPIPIAVELPDTNSLTGVYLVDLEVFTDDQWQEVLQYPVTKLGLPLTETRDNTEPDLLGIPAEECIMQRVTLHQVDLIKEQYEHNLKGKFEKQHLKGGKLIEAYVISQQIISFLLGYDWVNRNIAENVLGTSEKRMAYLRLDLSTEQKRYEHQDRLIDLADSLFLLQDCEGFDLKIEDLRNVTPTNPDVMLEDTVIELQIAKLLVKSGHKVTFVAPTGKKKNDFDLQIDFMGEVDIFAEIKCKREESPASANSLRNTLRKARSQLPEKSPSILFIRLPTNWTKDVEFVSRTDEVIADFFRNVSRVNAVIFVWEEWVTLEDNRRLWVLKFRPSFNLSPKYSIKGLDRLIKDFGDMPTTENSFMSLSFGEFSS